MEVVTPGRKGCGRRRIEIKKIENQRKRWVAFSKRKKGLLSKADRLSSLSGEDIGIVIISEQGRVYTSDNADSVIHRYRSMNKDSNSVGRNKEQFETRCQHEASTSALPPCGRHEGRDNDADQTIVKERDDHSQEMRTPALKTLDLICQLENSIPCLDTNNDAADVTNRYRSWKMVKEHDHDIEKESTMLELKLWSFGHEQRASTTTSDDDDDEDDNEDENVEKEDVDNDSRESKNGREVEEQALIPLIDFLRIDEQIKGENCLTDPNKIPNDELS
ncbi:hypothetical protein HRI_002672500 [Hibiscus trionum]|uniref:MADS-box domain-containing protein n=1 Tax=Hibiscus trionum TaxID=183268 RepID=A0A9W7M4Z2_HIBTR|nr:hypothetical protein HRI_002672500 [Hibiscus trionum]